MLILMPGPNVGLIVATSLARGRRAGLLIVAGTTTGLALQASLVAAGLGTLAVQMAGLFEALRWAGVAYLLWLGWQALRDHPPGEPRPLDQRRLVLRGLLVSLSNPKTLLFLGAFLPQFVDPSLPVPPQLQALGAIFVLLALGLDSAYATLAGGLIRLLQLPAVASIARGATAGMLWASALGLALARRS